MSKCGVIAVASVALLVSSCSVVGGSSDANDGDAGAASSPLADFLGIGDLGNARSDDAQARLLDIQREINDSVAACMTAQGFEFVPPDLDEVTSFDSAGPDGIEYGTPEYTARYGFGVTTQRWPQSTVGPELVGYEDFSESEYIDPNQAYLEGLTEAERIAYDAALYGDGPDYEWDPSLTDDENQERAEAFYADYDASGCYAEAEQGGAFANVSAFYEEFGDQLFELYDQIESDPRVTQRLAEIEQCITEQGFDYVDPISPYEHWEPALSEIDQQHLSWPANESGDGPSAPVMDDEGKALLAPLQAEEIAIATATDECGGSQTELMALYESVRNELEQQFLDDNADAVAGFRADGS
ncbi:MAG: hypothetical protein R2733_00405 [Acidimicrobiales bacterium]